MSGHRDWQRPYAVFLVGAGSQVEKVLRRLGVIALIGEDHCHASRLDALHHTVRAIGTDPEATPSPETPEDGL